MRSDQTNKILHSKWKINHRDNLYNERKYLQTVRPTRAYYPKYATGFYKSVTTTITKQPYQKIARTPK